MPVTTLPLLLSIKPAEHRSAPREWKRRKLPWVLNLLLLYLAGITVFGKGPTYIGMDPFFWGEAVLLLSLVWASRRWNRVALQTSRTRMLVLLIGCFLTLGAAETGRDYGIWGLNALRDSALWYYALFYFVGLVIASDGDQAGAFLARWKICWLVAVPWVVTELLSDHWLSEHTPMISAGRAFRLLGTSGSESVQSLGLGCLLLISAAWRGSLARNTTLRVLAVVVGLGAMLTYPGRGARLAVLMAFLIVTSVNFSQGSFGRRFRRKFWVVGLILLMTFAGAIASGVDLVDRFSLDRFSEAAPGSLEGTANWRAQWWNGLFDAVKEQSPAFGLGFGDPLTEYNPFIESANDSVLSARSPHNVNMTVFARMGIVGSVLWAGILLLGLFVPLWEILTPSSVKGRTDAAFLSFWIAVLFAIWVNASFGVLMEGPVSGIPFWLLLGVISGRVKTRGRTSRGYYQEVAA